MREIIQEKLDDYFFLFFLMSDNRLNERNMKPPPNTPPPIARKESTLEQLRERTLHQIPIGPQPQRKTELTALS